MPSGNGLSSSPSNNPEPHNGPRFPKVTAYDNVRAQHKLVTEKFGKDKWQESLAKAGMDRDAIFLATSNVDAQLTMKAIASVCEVLGVTPVQAADAFGDYWVNVFASKIYAVHFRGVTSARDFLLKMNEIHRVTTATIPDARPPRFAYDWTDPNTLVMTYESQRGLIDILVGLIKGVGRRFDEDLRVSKVGTNRVQVVFPATA